MLKSHRSSNTIRLELGAPTPPIAARVRSQSESLRRGSWSDGWFRKVFYAPRPEQTKHASMSLCLEMRLDLSSPVWLLARGTSMFPWRLPGCKMKLERVAPDPEIGMILVFRHGAKLYYHRVIERVSGSQWRTKGDTLIDSDEPVSNGDVIGRVSAVRRGNRVRELRPDHGAAWISRRLGRWFDRFGPSSGRLKRLGIRAAYLAVLLCAWPLRRLLARRDVDMAVTAACPGMKKD